MSGYLVDSLTGYILRESLFDDTTMLPDRKMLHLPSALFSTTFLF